MGSNAGYCFRSFRLYQAAIHVADAERKIVGEFALVVKGQG